MEKHHWKQLTNPDYIGAYALEPGKDIIGTIKYVKNEMVVGSDGKKEECIVAHFIEDFKPMILNVTNCKMIQKIYGTPYIEEWAGCKIQIYSEKVKAFGDVVEALRIRPNAPKTETVSLVCKDCGGTIEGYENFTAEQISRGAMKKYKRELCTKCMEKIKAEKTVEVE